jgi:hypothetical protein
LILPPFALAAGLVAVAGCTQAPPEPAPKAEARPDAKPDADAHAHKPGAHGGHLVGIDAADTYHAEAVFGADGVLRLYTLGKDESRVVEADAQPVTAYVKPLGGTQSEPLELKPAPQAGDAPGKASQFVAALPPALHGKPVEVTVLNIRFGGERFRFVVQSADEGHAEPMPAKVADAEEQELYLRPGGKYTKEDIAANGRMTASQKFAGLRSSHNADPKPGDRVCPITDTKTNPKFRWVVGGKAYEFCCPPCVDEFVKLAKEHPEEVKDPAAYVKK